MIKIVFTIWRFMNKLTSLLLLSSIALLHCTDITRPFLQYQSLPVESGFLAIKELSNVLTIQRNSDRSSGLYQLVVGKIYPYSEVKVFSGLKVLPLYIPFIKKDGDPCWKVFTGFDKGTKNLGFYPDESLPYFLKIVVAEMNLFAPKLYLQKEMGTEQSGRWTSMLNMFVSAIKSKSKKSIYEEDPTTNLPDVKIRKIKLFADLPDGQEDLFTDVYRGLSSILPFWVANEDYIGNQQRMKNPSDFSTYYLLFTKNNGQLPETVDDGYTKIDLSKNAHICSTVLEHASLIFSQVPWLHDLNGKKKSDIEYRYINSYLSKYIYHALFDFFYYAKTSHPDQKIAAYKIKEFIDLFKAYRSKANGQSVALAVMQPALSDFLATMNSVGDEQVALIRAYFNQQSSQKDEFSDLSNTLFSEYETTLAAADLGNIYSEQVQMKEGNKTKVQVIPDENRSRIQYVFYFYLLFNSLHKSICIITNAMENYFRKLNPEHGDSFVEGASPSGIQKLDDMIALYHNLSNLVHHIREVYPSFGQLPYIPPALKHESLPNTRSQDSGRLVAGEGSISAEGSSTSAAPAIVATEEPSKPQVQISEDLQRQLAQAMKRRQAKQARPDATAKN